MARRKKPNVWQQYGRLKPYDRNAGRVLYGEFDVERTFVVPGQDAEGNLVFGEIVREPATLPTLVRWVDALLAFDDREHHDAMPLVALLESDTEILPVVGTWLRDLMRRHEICCEIEDFIAQRRQLACVLRDFILPPRAAGRPGIPNYDMSDRDAELHIDNEKVTDHLKEDGGSVDAAIEKVISEKGPRARAGYKQTLTLFRKGKHTSARTAAKRRRR